MQEWTSGLIAPWNRWLEPTAALVFALCGYGLGRWTRHTRALRVAAVLTFSAFLAGNMLVQLFLLPPPVDHFEFLTTVYWLPLCYGAAFLFLPSTQALVASLLVFGLLSVPLWATLGIKGYLHWGPGFPELAAQIGIAQFVYIALWAAVATLRARYYRTAEHARLMESLALADPLTGLPNRRALMARLDAELHAARRHGHALSAALIDIDHFKRINDQFGHADGDQVLQAIGPLLQGELRASDHLGRWGGEEFLLVCSHASQAACAELAERLRAAVEAFDFPHGARVTISVGVATLQAGEDMQGLVGRADKALYAAKEQGRNRVVLHAAQVQQRAPDPVSA